MENTRRSFLKKVTAAGIGTAGLALSSNAAATVAADLDADKKKKTAGKDDGKLRFGFIGTGSRCKEHINNVLAIPGNKIVAICDIQQGPSIISCKDKEYSHNTPHTQHKYLQKVGTMSNYRHANSPLCI